MSGMRCDICQQFLVPESDSYKWITVNGKKVMGYGRITFTHTKPCTPAPPRVYEKEDEEDSISCIPSRNCQECKKRFTPRSNNHAAKMCSPECRKLRRDRKHAESHAKRGKYWKLRVIASLNLPIRKCIECKCRFTVSTKYSAKQVLCSAKCVKARQARKDRERAA